MRITRHVSVCAEVVGDRGSVWSSFSSSVIGPVKLRIESSMTRAAPDCRAWRLFGRRRAAGGAMARLGSLAKSLAARQRRFGEHFRARLLSAGGARRLRLLGAGALFRVGHAWILVGLRRGSTEATFRDHVRLDSLIVMCPSSSCSPTARVPTRSTRRSTADRCPLWRGCATRAAARCTRSRRAFRR